LTEEARVSPPPGRLPVVTTSTYGLGDLTINGALASPALVDTPYVLTGRPPRRRRHR
jgi:hypothetical protein